MFIYNVIYNNKKYFFVARSEYLTEALAIRWSGEKKIKFLIVPDLDQCIKDFQSECEIIYKVNCSFDKEATDAYNEHLNLPEVNDFVYLLNQTKEQQLMRIKKQIDSWFLIAERLGLS